MMMQSWMGSDFTNDDIARDSSLVDDYTPHLLGRKTVDGVELIGIELIPHDDAPVVWARMEAWVETERMAPRRFIYFDEPEAGRYEAVRTMRLDDVRMVQGRPLPHRWEMVPNDKEGHKTSFRVEEVRFDEPIDDDVFTQENLRRAEAVR